MYSYSTTCTCTSALIMCLSTCTQMDAEMFSQITNVHVHVLVYLQVQSI